MFVFSFSGREIKHKEYGSHSDNKITKPYITATYITVEKFGVSKISECFWTLNIKNIHIKVTYAHQGYIYLIKNKVKILIL